VPKQHADRPLADTGGLKKRGVEQIVVEFEGPAVEPFDADAKSLDQIRARKLDQFIRAWGGRLHYIVGCHLPVLSFIPYA